MRIDKRIIVFSLWLVAVILFVIVGLDINSLKEENLDYIGLGLAFSILGFIVNTFME